MKVELKETLELGKRDRIEFEVTPDGVKLERRGEGYYGTGIAFSAATWPLVRSTVERLLERRALLAKLAEVKDSE